jgi:hypothetical protein
MHAPRLLALSRDLILGRRSFAANCTNGWFSHRIVTLGYKQTKHFSRCERTQRENRIHGAGSLPSFAAERTNVSFANIICFLTL